MPPPSALGALGFGGCLGLVAWLADCLQVVVIVRSAIALGDDVIDLRRQDHLAIAQAYLAEAGVTLENALAVSVPLSAIPSLMPASPSRIGECAGLAVCLMRRAVA